MTVSWTPQQADRLKVSMQKKSQEKMQNAQMNALALTREYFLLGCACLSKGAGCLCGDVQAQSHGAPAEFNPVSRIWEIHSNVWNNARQRLQTHTGNLCLCVSKSGWCAEHIFTRFTVGGLQRMQMPLIKCHGCASQKRRHAAGLCCLGLSAYSREHQIQERHIHRDVTIYHHLWHITSRNSLRPH